MNIEHETISVMINRKYKGKLQPFTEPNELIPIKEAERYQYGEGWRNSQRQIEWAVEHGKLSPYLADGDLIKDKKKVPKNEWFINCAELLTWCQWRDFTRTFRKESLTVREMLIAIWYGHAFHPLTDGKGRKKSNLVQADYVALDFDTCDKYSSLEHLSNTEYAKYASFAYTSPSHTAEKPKARMVWVLETPISDLEQLELLNKALMTKYTRPSFDENLNDVEVAYCDESTKDGTRLFYGAEKCDTWTNWQCLPDSVVSELVAEYKKKELAEREEMIKKQGEHIKPAEVSQKLVGAIVDSLMANVRNAPDGEKHTTLNKMAFVMGGYVGGGYLNQSHAEDLLFTATSSIPSVKDLNSAQATIRKAVQDGMSSPLTINDRDDVYGKPNPKKKSLTLSQTIKDLELTPEQAKQEIDAIQCIRDKSYLNGYQDALTATQEAYWGRLIDPPLISTFQLGYRKREVDGNTGEIVVNEAYTMPYIGANGEVSNMEYRNDGGYSYEDGTIPPVYIANRFIDSDIGSVPSLLFLDNMDAIKAYMRFGTIEPNQFGGDRLRFVGLPHDKLLIDSFVPIADNDNIIIVLGRDCKTAGRNLPVLMGKCRVLRLPLPFDRAVNSMKLIDFERFLVQSKPYRMSV